MLSPMQAALACAAAFALAPTPRGAERPPLVLAHRGMMAEAPENTLPAFRLCVGAGLSIELDVHLTKDGVPVVIHDATLDRTTNGKGPVAGHSLKELRKLDAGAWFGPAFTGARIPTLDEVYDLVRQTDRSRRVFIAVNIKQLYPGLESAIVAATRRHGMLNRAFAFPVPADSIGRFKRADRRFAVVVARESAARLETLLEDGRIDGVRFRRIPELDEFRRIRTAGKAVYVVGVDDREGWLKLAAMGVHGFISDHPRQAHAIVRVP